MSFPEGPDRGPVGPLGSAFADLAAGSPPTDLSAASVIDTANRESHRRHLWVLGTGVAAAVVAVSTLIGVSVSQTGGAGDSSSAAPVSSAFGSASAPALAESPGTSESEAGGGVAAPDQQGSDGDQPAESTPAPTIADCDPGLSVDQQDEVNAALPGLIPTADCSAVFIGRGVTVTVAISAAESGCPDDDASACSDIDGHPGVLVLATPGDRPVNEGSSTTVIGTGEGRTVTVTVERDDATGELPFPVDDLATLVETLLGS